jgi:cell wall-associated NlpC family hydrolase
VRVRKWPLIALLAAGGLGGGVAAYAATATSSDDPPPKASIEDWRWAPRDAPPTPREPPKPPPEDTRESSSLGVSEPEIERDPVAPEPAAKPEPIPEPPPLPKPSDDDAITRAEVLDNGVALPPLEAPPEVRTIIEAGNQIARTPYKWGGGHGKWQDTGYDCSGSVSYALAAAGLLRGPLASGPLMGWGRPGKGKWLTIYTNPGHVFMIIAGVRFDTSAANRGKTGSRFTNEMRPTGGYVARHWPGL